jgi:hypothetical protein
LGQIPPYHRFNEFLEPGADRPEILRKLLKELGLPCQPVDIAGSRHLILRAREGKGSFILDSSRIILISHYDRVENSPGANDNSAAVFQLIETALKLRERGLENWLIIFTDKEEIPPGAGIRDQGSFTLATALREIGLWRGRFYIFDSCGVGDTLIISTMVDYLMKHEEGVGIAQTRRQIQRLRNYALETARNLGLEKVLLVPTPFSDDAGFLRAGIAAQTITVLPSPEASRFASLLRSAPDFPLSLVRRPSPGSNPENLGIATPGVPATWATLNGPLDTPSRLTPEHYKSVVRFACGLCGA